LGVHRNKYLQAAWNKYGGEAFVFEILEFTNQLDEREQFWMDYMGCTDPEKGYNHCPIARSSRGVKRGPQTIEQRKKKSQYLKGKCGCGIASPVRRGTDSKQSKLTDDIVREIRQKYGEHSPDGRGRPKGSVSYKQLAREYGVTQSVICEAIRRVTWKHVQ
jgi:hypothetical protein